MKIILTFILGMILASGSIGAALHGAEQWQAMTFLGVGASLMILSLFMLVESPRS